MLEAQGGEHATDGENSDVEEEEEPLEWEESRQALPSDQEKVMSRQQAGSLQVDLRNLFEGLSRWQGLKDKPEVNNHRLDSTNKVDKLLRAAQQKAINLQRLCAVLHPGMPAAQVVLGQQIFFLLLELERWLLEEQEEQPAPLCGGQGPAAVLQ